jgi:hypothetical protein
MAKRRRYPPLPREGMHVFTDEEIVRFWSHVQIGEPDECWCWNARGFSNGYAYFRYSRRLANGRRVSYHVGAHVMALLLKLGHDRFDVARHTCDRRRCCNPEHLVPGTHGDNLEDAYARGRRGRLITHRHDSLGVNGTGA